MMGFKKRAYQPPVPLPGLVAAGLLCSWCGEPLAASAATVLTATGRRHAYVMTVLSTATGRPAQRCQINRHQLAAQAFASVDAYRAHRRLELEERRKRRIERELQGLEP